MNEERRRRETAEYRRHHANAADHLEEALREVGQTLELGPGSNNAITDHLRRALTLCNARAGRSNY